MNTKLKPFDLEAALRGEPVVTRDGREVKIAGVNLGAKDLYKVVGWLDGITAGWCIDGKTYLDYEDSTDLFMATKTVKKEGWVNLYKSNISDLMASTSHAYKTEEEAKDNAVKRYYITTIKIEWEEEI